MFVFIPEWVARMVVLPWALRSPDGLKSREKRSSAVFRSSELKTSSKTTIGAREYTALAAAY